MAQFFFKNERKLRSDVYFRYENHNTPTEPGADDGKCAAVFKSNWGPLGEVVVLNNINDISKIYGDGGTDGTIDVIREEFKGGALEVYAARLGTGGTKGEYQIMDTSATPVAVIKLELKYPGSKPFLLTIRPTAVDPDVSELLLLDGTIILERFVFNSEAGVDQVVALMNALKRSKYFTATKLADFTTPIAVIDQAAIIPGTNPASYTVMDYTAAFESLEVYRWNVLAIDTSDNAIHLVMQQYLNRIFQNGKLVQGVIGEPVSVDFDTRLENSAEFNDYQVVYIGGSGKDKNGELLDGWQAAARIAGVIAGTPSNEVITHTELNDLVDIGESLTNIQYEQAIKSGMILFSLNSKRKIWIAEGINTLVDPGDNDDDGWRKIKRVKTRFELFQRINDAIEPVKVNNDSDGRATIIQLGNGICNNMVAEKKLFAGAHLELDPDNPPYGDSAWFRVYADDIDALEKIYLTYLFRFAPDEQ
jgi:hypothetical protein